MQEMDFPPFESHTLKTRILCLLFYIPALYDIDGYFLNKCGYSSYFLYIVDY